MYDTSKQPCPKAPSSPTPSPNLADPVLFDSMAALRGYRSPGDLSLRENFTRERSLPVHGRAQGGEEGSLVIEDSPIDWTFRPADLQGVNDAFAVFVSGDSMFPKYKNGDLVYIHPTKAPKRDRFVLVETTEHRGFIKQFVSWQDDKLVLRQFNPEQEIILPRHQVSRLMLAIGSLDI